MAGNVFGVIATADFRDVKDVMLVRCLVFTENLEPRAAWLGWARTIVVMAAWLTPL